MNDEDLETLHEVIDAMANINDTLNARSNIDKTEKEKEKAVIDEADKPVLSSNEKLRYKNIGISFTEGSLVSINELLKKLDKEKKLSGDIEKTLAKPLIDNIKKENSNTWFKNFVIWSSLIGITLYTSQEYITNFIKNKTNVNIKDEISIFWEKLNIFDNVKNLYSSITNFSTNIYNHLMLKIDTFFSDMVIEIKRLIDTIIIDFSKDGGHLDKMLKPIMTSVKNFGLELSMFIKDTKAERDALIKQEKIAELQHDKDIYDRKIRLGKEIFNANSNIDKGHENNKIVFNSFNINDLFSEYKGIRADNSDFGKSYLYRENKDYEGSFHDSVVRGKALDKNKAFKHKSDLIKANSTELEDVVKAGMPYSYTVKEFTTAAKKSAEENFNKNVYQIKDIEQFVQYLKSYSDSNVKLLHSLELEELMEHVKYGFKDNTEFLNAFDTKIEKLFNSKTLTNEKFVNEFLISLGEYIKPEELARIIGISESDISILKNKQKISGVISDVYTKREVKRLKDITDFSTIVAEQFKEFNAGKDSFVDNNITPFNEIFNNINELSINILDSILFNIKEPEDEININVKHKKESYDKLDTTLNEIVSTNKKSYEVIKSNNDILNYIKDNYNQKENSEQNEFVTITDSFNNYSNNLNGGTSLRSLYSTA